MPDFIKKN